MLRMAKIGRAAHVIWCRIALIFSICWMFVKIDTKYYPFSNTQTWKKLITTFFTGYFPSPSICHKNLKFCWKLLRTIIYSLELEKLIITFFRKKMEKCEFVTADIYWKIYSYTPIYRTHISCIYKFCASLLCYLKKPLITDYLRFDESGVLSRLP